MGVAEFHRILKLNGTILISVPFVGEYHTCPHDYWRYTHEGIQVLLQNFSDIKIVQDLSPAQCLISVIAHFINSKTQEVKRKWSKWLGHICIVPLNLLGLCFNSSEFKFKTGYITSSFIAEAKKQTLIPK